MQILVRILFSFLVILLSSPTQADYFLYGSTDPLAAGHSLSSDELSQSQNIIFTFLGELDLSGLDPGVESVVLKCAVYANTDGDCTTKERPEASMRVTGLSKNAKKFAPGISELNIQKVLDNYNTQHGTQYGPDVFQCYKCMFGFYGNQDICAPDQSATNAICLPAVNSTFRHEAIGLLPGFE